MTAGSRSTGPRVLVTTDYLAPGDEVDRYLRGHGLEVLYDPLVGRRDPDRLVESLEGCAAALIANEPMDADVLTRCPDLRVIVRTGVGYDSVDVAAAASRGISVSNLPGINARAVAEYTMGLILSAARGLVPSALGVREGRWPREDGHELHGATLGLLGYGAAARAVIPLADAFGMNVMCATAVPPDRREHPSVRFVELTEVLAAADYLSIHTALDERTKGLLDADALALMKPTAVLINTARGAIVDEQALADAVMFGRLAGAHLDVTCIEPLPESSPLRGVDGIVVYSHLAGQTAEARRAAGVEGAVELVSALAGAPAHSVNAHLFRGDA